MPILRIEADGTAPGCFDGQPLGETLADRLGAEDGPVTVMVHGYRYRPGDPLHCPFRAILSPHPDRRGARFVGWPPRLGVTGAPGTGIGIAYGWQARGHLWAAHEEAGRAGRALATLLHRIAALAPDRPVRLVAHSMGARVVLEAVQMAPEAQVRHMILMAAAEYMSAAAKALASPGGRAGHILNVSGSGNAVFDLMFAAAIGAPEARDRVLGRLPAGGTHAGLTTLQIDDMACRAALARLGYPIAARDRRICHWAPYLRRGVFALYRALLSGHLDPQILRRALSDTAARATPRAPQRRKAYA